MEMLKTPGGDLVRVARNLGLSLDTLYADGHIDGIALDDLSFYVDRLHELATADGVCVFRSVCDVHGGDGE